MRSRLSVAVRTGAGFTLVLVAIVLGFAALSEHFLTLTTFRTLANQIPPLIALSVGMTLVLLVGGIDLSVGSVAALAGAVLGVGLVDWGLSPVVAALLAVASGLLCGGANGWLSVRFSIPSFIVTLGMLEIARGAAYLTTDSQTKYIGPSAAGLSNSLPGIGISLAFGLSLALVAFAHFLVTRTVYGRRWLAIGTNEQAVRLAGVNPRRYKISVFVLSGGCAGLAGVFQVAYLQSADPNAGIGIELSAIAAAVIGGTSLMGGRGSVARSLFGVLVIALVQTGLAQIGASEPSKRVVTGVVIVVAVLVDVFRQRAARSGD